MEVDKEIADALCGILLPELISIVREYGKYTTAELLVIMMQTDYERKSVSFMYLRYKMTINLEYSQAHNIFMCHGVHFPDNDVVYQCHFAAVYTPEELGALIDNSDDYQACENDWNVRVMYEDDSICGEDRKDGMLAGYFRMIQDLARNLRFVAERASKFEWD